MLSNKAKKDFENKVLNNLEIDTITNCWLYKGKLNPKGYGYLMLDTLNSTTHRFSYIYHKGDLDKTQVVRHSCDVPRCVNPVHLLAGTQQDNINDMVERGRQSKGEEHAHSKLSELDVIAIYLSVESHSVLRKKYNTSSTCIEHIRQGRNWGHLTKNLIKPTQIKNSLNALPDKIISQIVLHIYRNPRATQASIAKIFNVTPLKLSNIVTKKYNKELLNFLQEEIDTTLLTRGFIYGS
jgi:hypothetical protein